MGNDRTEEFEDEANQELEEQRDEALDSVDDAEAADGVDLVSQVLDSDVEDTSTAAAKGALVHALDNEEMARDLVGKENAEEALYAAAEAASNAPDEEYGAMVHALLQQVTGIQGVYLDTDAATSDVPSVDVLADGDDLHAFYGDETETDEYSDEEEVADGGTLLTEPQGASQADVDAAYADGTATPIDEWDDVAAAYSHPVEVEAVAEYVDAHPADAEYADVEAALADHYQDGGMTSGAAEDKASHVAGDVFEAMADAGYIEEA